MTEPRLALAALQYAEAGWRVFPIKPDAKAPPLTRHGSKDATSDVFAVRRLWELTPAANIGLATGNGLAVIDVDPRSGGVRDSAWPETLTARTPSGGLHLYYGTEFEVRNSASALAPGVDVRGEGGYVVAPPSEGRAWHKDSGGELTTLPGVLLAACMRSEPAAGTFEPRQHVPAGERHDYLVRAAGWMLANEIADDLESLLAEVMAHASQVCAPWPASEMARVWTHVRGICKWVIAREDGAR